ncbi:uroporphyrinogen decarboxylase family protein [Candidatus Vecturithrix granuli]|uniref:Uroporphyrinogen decarboxylase family protein n=1 Tax=Vecturithrix granuli TaxID=1499967 RepID=A0A0S6WAY8_VECG1|nr:uroporphyrinogen decarboxylase family protein [Candidatus Vecturithrix granuli]
MTSLERILSVFQGKTPDRIPVVPIIGQTAARLNGMRISEELRSPETLADSRIACRERFQYDGVYVSAETWVTAEAMGAPVQYSEDAPVQGTTPLLADKKQIDRLIPADPACDGRLPLLVKALEIAVRRAQDQFAVIGNFDQSPFSLACALRGINQVMLDVYDNPVFIKKLLDICTETVIRYARAMAEAGAHILNTGDSPAMLLGPENYQKFALPYQQQVFDELQPYDIPTTLHICGNTTKLLDLMSQSHAHSLELDAGVDLVAARSRLSEHITIIGNIDPVGVLLHGRPQDVSASVKSLCEHASQLGRFILASGCTLAPDTPPENIQAMVTAAQSAQTM